MAQPLNLLVYTYSLLGSASIGYAVIRLISPDIRTQALGKKLGYSTVLGLVLVAVSAGLTLVIDANFFYIILASMMVLSIAGLKTKKLFFTGSMKIELPPEYVIAQEVALETAKMISPEEIRKTRRKKGRRERIEEKKKKAEEKLEKIREKKKLLEEDRQKRREEEKKRKGARARLEGEKKKKEEEIKKLEKEKKKAEKEKKKLEEEKKKAKKTDEKKRIEEKKKKLAEEEKKRKEKLKLLEEEKKKREEEIERFFPELPKKEYKIEVPKVKAKGIEAEAVLERELPLKKKKEWEEMLEKEAEKLEEKALVEEEKKIKEELEKEEEKIKVEEKKTEEVVPVKPLSKEELAKAETKYKNIVSNLVQTPDYETDLMAENIMSNIEEMKTREKKIAEEKQAVLSNLKRMMRQKTTGLAMKEVKEFQEKHKRLPTKQETQEISKGIVEKLSKKPEEIPWRVKRKMEREKALKPEPAAPPKEEKPPEKPPEKPLEKPEEVSRVDERRKKREERRKKREEKPPEKEEAPPPPPAPAAPAPPLEAAPPALTIDLEKNLGEVDLSSGLDLEMPGLEDMGIGEMEGLEGMGLMGGEMQVQKKVCPNCHNAAHKTVFCPNCGTGYCSNCAASISRIGNNVVYKCPNCGKEVEKEA